MERKNSIVFTVYLSKLLQYSRRVSQRMSTLYNVIVLYSRNTSHKIVTFITSRLQRIDAEVPEEYICCLHVM